MDPDWVRAIRDQCVAAGVPFFFKQWGGVRKGKSGRDAGGRCVAIGASDPGFVGYTDYGRQLAPVPRPR